MLAATAQKASMVFVQNSFLLSSVPNCWATAFIIAAIFLDFKVSVLDYQAKERIILTTRYTPHICSLSTWNGR